MTKTEFQIEVLTCPICVEKIETAWTKTDGVADVKVLFNASKVKTSFDDRVTGESIPVRKQVDDDVFSGTIIDNGYIEIIAEKVSDDTTFAKNIERVEEKTFWKK